MREEQKQTPLLNELCVELRVNGFIVLLFRPRSRNRYGLNLTRDECEYDGGRYLLTMDSLF